MTRSWNTCFDAAYAPEQVAEAAQQVLSREAQHTDDPEALLLMDLISEVACKLRMDEQVNGGVSIRVSSPNGHFKEIALDQTGQFTAYLAALKHGAIDEDTDQQLALQSAAANVLGQALDQGVDLTGAEIKTTPLGFENHIEKSLPRTGLLSRIIGRLK